MDSKVSHNATPRGILGALLLSAALAGPAVLAQPAGSAWRRVANAAVDLSLADVATGPVDQVWYASQGLAARTETGRTLLAAGFEQWRELARDSVPPRAFADPAATGAQAPEPGARLVGSRRRPARAYALGKSVWRSDDGGLNWVNLTRAKAFSILGEDLRDLAVSPEDPDDLAVAGRHGVWRSVDGGATWSGLNEALPNLPVRRILSVPENGRALRAEVAGIDGLVEWPAGEKRAWRRSITPITLGDPALQQALLKQVLGERLGQRITAAIASGEYVYIGTANGRLAASPDLMSSWRWLPAELPGPVAALAVDPADGAMAIAVVAAAQGARVWRTLNGGLVWDDITADLPAGAVRGVAFDRAAGAIYTATDNGLYLTNTDLRARGPETPWQRIDAGLASGAVTDVKLNAGETQIYAAVDGWGVYTARAPHRRRDPKVVSAADQSQRAAAPGSLLSVVGTGVKSARAGNDVVPVLASSGDEAQIQIPFSASGDRLALVLDARWNISLTIEATSPAIFLDADGAPMLIDAETGLVVDAHTAIRPGTRLQVMAAGLGRVEPAWPAGKPAPLENAPHVVAPVRVVFDRVPLEPLRATLAPGYVGLYLVEFQVPTLVNAGAVEIYLEAGARASNRSRLFVEP